MKPFLKILLPSVLLLPAPLKGQSLEAPKSVIAGLAGVCVVADTLSRELVEGGITREGIEAYVRLRLRESGVTVLDPGVGAPAPGDPTLYIHLAAILTPGEERCTYTIRLDLMQTARLERDPSLPPIHVSTWGVSGVAFHGHGWRQAIIDDILAYTDAFAAAFTAANPPGAD